MKVYYKLAMHKTETQNMVLRRPTGLKYIS